jgi:hypothetical protein
MPLNLMKLLKLTQDPVERQVLITTPNSQGGRVSQDSLEVDLGVVGGKGYIELIESGYAFRAFEFYYRKAILR